MNTRGCSQFYKVQLIKLNLNVNGQTNLVIKVILAFT
nr:MAG TPA: hypothetical protein [Caudoviricetes sp.]